jgi:hypothetical protein
VHADGSGSEQPLLPRLLREIDALPARVRAIYLRSLFESLIDQRADELDARELGRRTARSLEHDFRDEGVNPDDAQALTAESALMLESDAAHSALAVALAERAALNEVADNEAVLRARRSWLRKTAWSPLSADPGTPLRTRYVVPREAPDTRALCAAWSDAGPRWTWLDRALTEIRVAPPFGTHAVALIRAPDDDPRESRVNVDGIPATVHGAAGLAAELAIAPGLHRFEIDAKRPLVARVARE